MLRSVLGLALVVPVVLSCGRRPCDGAEKGPSVRLDVSLAQCNATPIADIQIENRNFAKGEPVVLDGAGSLDLNGDALTFSWSIVTSPEGSLASFDATSGPKVSLTPDRSGAYTVALVVNDGELDSPPAELRINVKNKLPVADAGANFPQPVGTVAMLDGRSSTDDDGDPLTYQWTIQSRPAGSNASLTNATSATPSFTIDVYGVYTVALVVNDGDDDSLPDTMRVGGGIVGGPPTANAGPDLNGLTGQSVLLNGSQSVDPDGDPITFQWRVTEEPVETFTELLTATATQAGLRGREPGRHVVELVVSDGFYDSAPDAAIVALSLGSGVSGDLCEVAGCGAGYACFEGTCIAVGRFRFSLSWSVISDFDLHVLTPDNSEIFFGNPVDAGGELDVDDCVGNFCRDPISHVENIVFLNAPMPGRYDVWVENFNGGAAGPFTIQVDGAAVDTFTDTLPAVMGATSQRFRVIVP